MPELAEVEFMARRLDDWLRGERVSVDIIDPKLDPRGALASWSQQVSRVYRRAKYAVIEGESDNLVLHFRMTGKVIRSPELQVRHGRALFRTSSERVHFVDMRRFGTMECVARSAQDAWEKTHRLGDEPWPEPRSGAWWQERLGERRAPIKKVLLEQNRVVGLGNILASELLFQARISPQRLAADVTIEEWAALSEALHTTVGKILSLQTGDEIAYVNQGASPQDAGFLVYGQEGASAPCCGAPILRSVDAGRSTFWCDHCQR